MCIRDRPYSALCGIAESLYRLYSWASVNGQEDQFTKNARKVLQLMLEAYARKHEPFGGTTRHRAFLWGPSAVYYTEFPTWVQNCWGINIVLNMDSTMGHNKMCIRDRHGCGWYAPHLRAVGEHGALPLRHGHDAVSYTHLPRVQPVLGDIRQVRSMEGPYPHGTLRLVRRARARRHS